MCNLDLIGLKCFSEPLAGKLYIEDYVGINTTELAMVADEHTLTGRALGEQLLKIAKNKVLGDLSFAQTNVSAKSTVDNMINTYGFNSYVVTGTGGVKKLDTSFLKKSVIIDDLTHNLLSFNESNADYCFASLRKQIPIAVGGFCLSKNNDFNSNISQLSGKNQ
jgi:hypothetical protein